MKIVKHPSVLIREQNIKALKILVDQYVRINKKEAINKIKSEQ